MGGDPSMHTLHGSAWHKPCLILQSMFFFLYPVHFLLKSVVIVVLVIVSLLAKVLKEFFKLFVSSLLFMIALSNSELCYLFYGDPEFFTLMTSAGVYLEDVPQFIIQVLYSIVMSLKFKQHVSAFQWISFALTFWHFGFSASYKYATFGEPPPPPLEEYFIDSVDRIGMLTDQPDNY